MIILRCYNDLKNLNEYVGKRARIFYNNVDFGVGTVMKFEVIFYKPTDVYKLDNNITVIMDKKEEEERLRKYVHSWADEGGVSELREEK